MRFILLYIFFLPFIFSCNASRMVGGATGNAEKDFETFWSTFRDHYAFFQLKGVNWDSSYKKYRPMIGANTNRKELLQVLAQMCDPLKDGHITISDGDEVLYKGKKASRFRETFKGREKEFWGVTDSLLQQAGFAQPTGVGPQYKGEHLYYACTNGTAAYIRISRCFGSVESLFDDSKEATDLALMCRLWDSLLTTYANVSRLIIDVRGNGGGHGGIELASRFADKKILTHYKATKQPGGYELTTPLQPQYLEPNTGIKFLKPVTVLTSDRTASSAEDFVISLCPLPQTTTVGTATSGMLSDMYGATLSGNWSFTLSNQRYYNTDSVLMEDAGVPPKMAVQNTLEDLQHKTDAVLLKALASL